MNHSLPRQAMEILANIAGDRRSGASEMLEKALALFELLASFPSAPVREACEALIAAQPEMAPLANLASAVARAGSSTEEALNEARRFVHIARGSRALSIENASTILAPCRTIMTHSRSSTVLDALAERAARGPLSVVITESRPLGEGRISANELGGRGIDVTLIADSAARSAMESCDAFVCGADEVNPEGVVNKIGTSLLALAANDLGIPSFVVTDRTKFSARPLSRLLRSSPADLWEDPPAFVRVEARLYERTPLHRFTAIATEDGVLSPEQAAEAARTDGV